MTIGDALDIKALHCIRNSETCLILYVVPFLACMAIVGVPAPYLHMLGSPALGTHRQVPRALRTRPFCPEVITRSSALRVQAFGKVAKEHIAEYGEGSCVCDKWTRFQIPKNSLRTLAIPKSCPRKSLSAHVLPGVH